MRSFATIAILAFVAVAAVNAQWFDDDDFDDFGDDDYMIYMGGYAPSVGFGPLSSGYVMGSVGSVGMGSVGSSIAYGHGGKSGKAMYIPYAVPTPVAAQPTPLPLELLYGNVQTTQNGLFGGNGSGLLCK